jgi:hypothetical protein
LTQHEPWPFRWFPCRRGFAKWDFVRPTAIPLSCAEATHAEGAADEVRWARGASAPGWRTARRQLQRFVRRREHIHSTCTCASYASPEGPPLWCGRCSGTALARFSAAPATGGKFEAASGQLITEQSNYRSARLREGPCLFAISHLRAAGAAAATHLQFTENGVDPTFFSLSANIPDRLTALALSCTAKARVLASSGAAAAAHTAGQQRVICSRRDTALVLFGRGASAPDRSRAVPASATS